MKKFFCGLCTSLLLSYALVTPLSSPISNSNDNTTSPLAFFVAVEGD